MLVASLFAIGLFVGWLVAGRRKKPEPDTNLYRGCEALPTPTPVGDPEELAAWDKRTDEKQLKRKRRHK